MSTKDTVGVDVVARTGGVRSGMKDAAESTGSAVQQMRNFLAQLGGASRDTGKHVDGLTGFLKDFKSEQVQNARTANFFASQLVEIIPGADGAKNALRGLIGIGLEGFGIGMAIEAGIFALASLKNAAEENEAAAKALKLAYADTFQTASTALFEAQRALTGARPKIDETWQKQFDEGQAKIRQLKKEIQDIEEHAGPLEQFANLFGPSEAVVNRAKQIAAIMRGLNDAKPLKIVAENNERVMQHNDISMQVRQMEAGLADDIIKINTEKDAKLLELDRRRNIIDPADMERLRVAIEQDASEKIRRIREDHVNQTMALERLAVAEGGDETLRIRAETENKLDELRTRLSRTRDEREQQLIRVQILAESVLGEKRIAIAEAANRKIAADALATYEKLKQDRINLLVQEERSLTDLQMELSDERFGKEHASLLRAAERDKMVLREAQRDHLISFDEMESGIAEIDRRTRKKITDGWVQSRATFVSGFINPITQTFQAAFHSLIDTSANFGDAMKNIAVAVADEIIGMLVKVLVESVVGMLAAKATATKASISKTQGFIAEAVAGAAASQAFIPIAGPALAAESAATMLAVLQGMTAPLLAVASAAGGIERVPHDNFLSILHRDEKVLPAVFSERLDNLLGRMEMTGPGGGGGGEVHAHFHLVAADGPSIDRLVQSSYFRQSLRNAARLGRVG